jgi:hypothetical protein
MSRMRTSPYTAGLSFRLSIERALITLYKRRAEIEDLIACLDSQTRRTDNRGLFMSTRLQLPKINKKESRHFRQLSSNTFQTHVKMPLLM